jgi:hypothetical protein
MAEKVRRYTEPVLVRLDKKTAVLLRKECKKRIINEAVYGRKAIELCLKKNLINGETH